MRHRPKPQISAAPSLPRFAAGLLCALAVAALVPSSASAAQGEMRCADVSFAVNLSPSDATDYNVFGVLCSRGGLRNKTIQVALHGSTYGHLYWDFPFQPEIYSYVRRATAEGYAVLNLDRIGVGRSDHPPAEAVTIESNAYVVHQIVQELRGGDRVVPPFGRVRAERVALVGHSLGSVISIQEAATYGDVDGVVLTGVSHTVTPALGDVSFFPASLDPHFAGRGIPDNYFTTAPGIRFRSIFYNVNDPSSFDRRIIRIDEKNKETTTVGELNTAIAGLSFSTGIHVPVLVVVGDSDAAFCNPPTCTASGSLATEPSFYPADACAEAVAIPGSGHVLNLHYQAPRTYTTILRWMNRRVGSNTKFPAPQPCP
jgi:pimeloyl-ACP methyl ester carboxylesterase